MLPHRASVMSSTRRTDTPARYISIRASSTLLSRRRYRSMMAVSKEIPLSLGTLRVTSPEAVSYTHLDVYKRQLIHFWWMLLRKWWMV